MKVTSTKVVIDEKKKKKSAAAATPERDSAKYSNFRKEDKSGRNSGTTGKKPNQQYSAGSAPRVGGTAPAASGLKGASKKQVKKAKSMVAKNTGSGASKQAKAAALRAYR